MLKLLVIFAGAAITMAEAGVIGWLCHRWLLDHAPGLGSLIPRDGGAVAGLAIGSALVLRWALV